TDHDRTHRDLHPPPSGTPEVWKKSRPASADSADSAPTCDKIEESRHDGGALGMADAESFAADEPRLDATDRAILVHLERDARISYSRLAQEVGIAESTCHKRVRALLA